MMNLLIVLMMCAAAPGPATAPSTRPSKPTVSPPNVYALHIEAFDLMLQEQYRKAAPMLEKIYKDTPPQRRNRALVLNHAIVDMSQKLVMRALKDLTEYLTRNRDPDEQATNILAGALNIAASNPKLKSGNIWQTAYKEWDRRNYVLDHSRKGYRRWGAKWLMDDEHAKVQNEIESLKRAVIEQADRTDRAYSRALSVSKQYENVVRERENKVYIMNYLNGIGQPGPLMGRLNLNPNDPNFLQTQSSPLLDDAMHAEAEARRLGPEMEAAIKEFNMEDAKFRALQGKVIRPEWPSKFEPVDPNGPEADKPPPLPAGNPDAATKPQPGGLRPLPQNRR